MVVNSLFQLCYTVDQQSHAQTSAQSPATLGHMGQLDYQLLLF
jgi:hypothetical protein